MFIVPLSLQNSHKLIKSNTENETTLLLCFPTALVLEVAFNDWTKKSVRKAEGGQ